MKSHANMLQAHFSCPLFLLQVNDHYPVLHSLTKTWGENRTTRECIRISGCKQEMSKLNMSIPSVFPSKKENQTPADKWTSWILPDIEYSSTKVKKLSFRVLSFVPAGDHICSDTPLLRCHPRVTNKQLPPEHPFLKQCCFSSRNQTTVSVQVALSHCHKESKDDKGRMDGMHEGSLEEDIMPSTQDVHSYSTGIPPPPYAKPRSTFVRTASGPLCPKYSREQHSIPSKSLCFISRATWSLSGRSIPIMDSGWKYQATH